MSPSRSDTVTGADAPFPNNLRMFRIAAGMTQQQLATAAGISLRTVLYVERGHGCTPRTKRAILTALGKDFLDLEQRHEVFPT